MNNGLTARLKTPNFYTYVARTTNYGISNGSLQYIPFNTAINNAFGLWSPAFPTRITIPSPGIWMMSAMGLFSAGIGFELTSIMGWSIWKPDGVYELIRRDYQRNGSDAVYSGYHQLAIVHCIDSNCYLQLEMDQAHGHGAGHQCQCWAQVMKIGELS